MTRYGFMIVPALGAMGLSMEMCMRGCRFSAKDGLRSGAVWNVTRERETSVF